MIEPEARPEDATGHAATSLMISGVETADTLSQSRTSSVMVCALIRPRALH